ncbi:amino acid/amide ABC transporter substrate-binding protein, HAAT family [Albimonas donghaensis]|uniref:Amino acid/amide ABC transporter substrate-binding protein, HAAT family n=1 Tax=Albimonas donghaensis TaxID=356660 RepID=A0A1H2X620_9RHOB|nr:ABC transporter substrate-binding protein [Albimonas donghaensis]SDW88245.1 amino acid/amide ABC transporter substrate-binding protein, HAAT family [Albimonas donghaensis]
MTAMFKSPSRRAVLRGGAAAAVTVLAAPRVLRAQPAAVKLGLLQPMSGFLAQAGDLARIGAEYAVKEINDAGGIKALGGAPVELIVGDSRSNAEAGAQATEELNSAGVVAIGGGFASGISLTATQAAARYDLPFLVDSAVADSITQRDLANTFRFGPNFTMATEVALANLVKLNDAAGKPAKTVALVHEDGLFGSGLAQIMQDKLPGLGFEIVEVISHPTPARDMSNVALRLRSLQPDLIIPSHYYNEFVLLARTLQQQRVKPKGIYAIFGGAASSYQFVSEYPEAAEGVFDCNHWGDPSNPTDAALKKEVEAQGKFFAYNAPINYSLVKVLAEAVEKAGAADRAAVIEQLASAEFASGVMPYGMTKFDASGQNASALPLNTQVQNGEIKVIYPADYAQAEPKFPV